MMLHGKIGIDRNIMLKDPTGKELAAKKVFSLAIKYLMDDFKKNIRKQNEGIALEEDIRIVLTVPAIWNDAAKQFMREAATEAGIPGDKLIIALEPEAASVYCRHLPVSKEEKGDKVSIATLETGSKYIVLDAGGGTVDVTVHEVLETGHLKEVHAPTGGAWGGALVDMAFKDFLNKCAGKKVIGHIKKKHPEDFMEIMRYFEMQKRSIHPDKTKKVTVRLPISSLTEASEETGQPFIKDKLKASAYCTNAEIKGDKLKLDYELVESFFTNSGSKIVEHIKSLLSIPDISDCFGIIMVGGLSESEQLQDKIRASFPDKKIIIPNEAGLSVLKGAVIFGHRPDLISRRVSKYTYGFDSLSRDIERYFDGEIFYFGELKYVSNVFYTLVHAGEDVKVGVNKYCDPVIPISQFQTHMRFDFYTTEKESPRYVTDDGCEYAGTLKLDISSFRMARINIRVVFGGTELKVELENVEAGEKKYFYINFLG